MDTIHRAHVHTGSIFGPDTGLIEWSISPNLKVDSF
jgi:hypothetical protein